MFSKLTLGIALSVALGATAPAVAARRCPPLQVGQGDFCDCIVQNYSPKDDLDVTIVVLGVGGGAPVSCGPSAIGPGDSKNCAVKNNQFFARCGCEVTGASKSSRVSLQVEGPAITDGAKAAVPCE